MEKVYQISCPSCGYRMQVEQENLGRTGTCPKCSHSFQVSSCTVDTVLDSDDPENSRRKQVDVAGIPVDWEVGNVFLDLYAVTDLLGEGGMGKVFKVRHLGWDIDLAVKCPKPQLLTNARAMEAFQQECETWVNLGLHPHTTSCYYVRKLGGFPRIFAEYVEGGSLRRWITRGKLYHGGHDAALERIMTVAIQVAWGLHHAHENNLVHRDVKSANVLLSRSGSAKVTDFGLASARLRVATLAAAGTQNRLASAGGRTPAYCSPEQARNEQVSQKTDIYSWAVCLLEMLCGGVTWKTGPQAPEALRRLMRNGPRRKRVPPTPPELARVITWCLSAELGDRPDDMLEVVRELRAIYRLSTGKPFEQEDPRSVAGRAESLNNRAVSLLDLGKSSEAEQTWLDALRAEPKHVESTFNLGLCRWRAGRQSDEALLQQMNEVVSMHPGEMLPAYLVAQIHVERGDCASALPVLEHLAGRYGPAEIAQLPPAAVRDRLPHSRRLLCSFGGHADAAYAVQLSRNGLYALSGSEDNTARLWEVSTGRCVRTFAGHAGAVESLVLRHDGRLAISASRDRTVKLWEVDQGQCTKTLQKHDASVTSVAASFNFDRLVSGGADAKVILWDLEAGRALRVFEEHTGEVTSVAITQDGTTALSGSRDGTLRLWDLPGTDCVHVLQGHEGAVRAVSISGGGRYAISGGEDGTLRLWNLASGRCVRTLTGHTDSVTAVSLRRDCRCAVSGGKDSTVRLWDLTTGCCLRTYVGHEGEVRGVDFAHGMNILASAGTDRTVKLWNVGARMAPFYAPLVLCEALRTETALSAEIAYAKSLDTARKYLKAGDPVSAAAHIRSTRSQAGFRRNAAAMAMWGQLYVQLPRAALTGAWEGETMTGHAGPVRSLALSSDGRSLLSGGEDGTVRLWDVANGQCMQTSEGHTGTVNSVCFGQDMSFALSGGADNTLRTWNPHSGECMRVFEEYAGTIESVALSPDNRFAVAGGWNISLWEIATGRCLLTFGGQTAAVFAVAWSPDGRYVLVGNSEEQVTLWDIATAECAAVLSGHAGVVRSVQASNDGRHALSCSCPMWGKPGQIYLWDLSSQSLATSFVERHTGAVNDAALSFDGRHAISGGTDSTVRIWDTATGDCVRVLTEQMGNVQAVRFSQDSRLAVACSEDGTIQVWILDWALTDRPAVEWTPEADPYLDAFLTHHRPYQAALPEDGPIDFEDVSRALTRKGKPTWSDEDLARLMHTLGCAGFGWIGVETVRRELAARSQGSLLGRLGSRFGPKRR